MWCAYLYGLQQSLPFTVLKLFCLNKYITIILRCNSPYRSRYWNLKNIYYRNQDHLRCNSPYRSRYWNLILEDCRKSIFSSCNSPYRSRYWNEQPRTFLVKFFCCNSPYRSRYWNIHLAHSLLPLHSCNSPYRSRYWNPLIRRETSGVVFSVATVLTVHGIETWIMAQRKMASLWGVATVLTVHGIETTNWSISFYDI